MVSSVDMPIVIVLPVAPASLTSVVAWPTSCVMSGRSFHADWNTLSPYPQVPGADSDFGMSAAPLYTVSMMPCRSSAIDRAWRTRTSPNAPSKLETMKASEFQRVSKSPSDATTELEPAYSVTNACPSAPGLSTASETIEL